MSAKDPFGGILPEQGKSYGTGTTGGGSMLRGFVGPFYLTHSWMVMTEQDLRSAEWADIVAKPNEVFETSTGKFQNYWSDDELAEAAKIATNVAYINHFIGGSCPNALDVLNLSSPENWANGVSSRTQVCSLGSKDWQKVVAYHMIFVPSFVQAVALMMAKNGISGWPTERLFSLDSIRDLSYAQFVGERDTPEGETFFGAFTDEAQKNLVGTGKADLDSATLWQARAALWAALGEPDPTKTAVHVDGPKRAYMTDAPNLAYAFKLMSQPWVAPMYSNFEFVDNPVVSAVSRTTGKRFTAPAFVEFYSSEAEAKEAIPDKADDTGNSSLPKAWKELGESAWYEALDAIKSDYGVVVYSDFTKVQLKDVTGKYMVSEDELKAWLSQ